MLDSTTNFGKCFASKITDKKSTLSLKDRVYNLVINNSSDSNSLLADGNRK